MSWKINGITLDLLGIDSLAVTLQNQADDFCEIRFPRRFDAALPDGFEIGQSVTVTHNADTIFVGEIGGPLRHLAPTNDYKSIFAFGPWHIFSQMPFTYAYPYVTGAQTTTHGILSGNANALLATILQTNVADIVQIGHIDVGNLVIPESEVYDQTIAQVIASILRYAPTAVVSFDYATTPPTIHILIPSSAHNTPVSINERDGRGVEVSIAPLHERLVTGVTLEYEASGQTSDRKYAKYQTSEGKSDIDTITSPVISSGFFLLGSDSAGDASSRRHFRRTIRLEGQYDVTRYIYEGQFWPYQPNVPTVSAFYTINDVFANLSDEGTTRKNKKLMVDRVMFFRTFVVGDAYNFAFDFNYSANASKDNVGWTSYSAGEGGSSTWRPLMRLGPAHVTASGVVSFNLGHNLMWGGGSDVFSRVATPLQIGVSHIALNWDFTNTAGQVGYNRNIVAATGHTVFANPADCGAINATTGRFTKIVTVDNTSAELPAPGIAVSLLAANDTLVYEGTIRTLRHAPPAFGATNRTITLQGIGVASIIQRTVFRSESGEINLTLGTPKHLGPQDLIALQRAGRE